MVQYVSSYVANIAIIRWENNKLCYWITFFVSNYSFGSSNVAYVGFIVVGLVVTETIYGYSTDALWNSINHGKTFETVDWSKFVVDDDDDDDDEDEEEEEEEEDDE